MAQDPLPHPTTVQERESLITRRCEATLVYFDLLEYPVTSFEVWRWLLVLDQTDPEPISLFEVLETLERMRQGGLCELHGGVFTVPGRGELAELRARRSAGLESKRLKARRIARLLRFFPFVRMCAVTGSLARGVPGRDSDLDFFVVAESGHIWTCRLLTVGWLALFRMRPREGRKRDTVCMNFFSTTRTLDVSSARLNTQDVHYTQWVAQFVPLFSARETSGNFFRANEWVHRMFPHVEQAFPVQRQNVPDAWVARAVRGTGEILCGGVRGVVLERWAKAFQLRILPATLRASAIQGDTAVVVSDTMLKFHHQDRRPAIEEALRHRLVA